MKKRYSFLLYVILVFSLLIALPALAYFDINNEPYTDETLPELYGTLNRRMATRVGPSTAYVEPGTFLNEGDQVRVVSIAYDHNDVPWVQVDFYYRGKHYRAYTGLKRFDGLAESEIPREDGTLYPPATVTCDVTPLRGPGEDYEPYSFTIKEGFIGYVVDIENGYCMLEYNHDSKDNRYRVWISADDLW